MTALQPAKAPVDAAYLRTDRVETPPVRQAVRSELTPPKVVTASAPPEPSRAYSREPLLDPQSRELIMRARDEAARPAVRRAPEKALQRLRAYLRASRLDEGRPQPRSDLNV